MDLQFVTQLCLPILRCARNDPKTQGLLPYHTVTLLHTTKEKEGKKVMMFTTI
jgi:hypothetical protein